MLPAPRVLVVESDVQTAAMARRCLERAGFSVEVGTSAPQALGGLERSWPELVVLDPPATRGSASASNACGPAATSRW